MSDQHVVLIVEDDEPTAQGIADILEAEGCRSITVTNKEEALEALRTESFCLILLDLEIKPTRSSLRGNQANGMSFLGELRKRFNDHLGIAYWLPVLIVSAHAKEVETAVLAMKEGADDVVHKPIKSVPLSRSVREAFERSGRSSHAKCSSMPASQGSTSESIELSVPGGRVKRRTTIRIGQKTTELTDSDLAVLLALMVARLDGRWVHLSDLGGKHDQGFKGISRLREAIRPYLPGGLDIVENDNHGKYRLTENVTIGPCATDRLLELGHAMITSHAKTLKARLSKSKGV